MSESTITQRESEIIASEIYPIRTLTLNRMDCAEGAYTVWVAYNGGRMTYQEQNGRKHRLSPGMLKITSMDEWRGIQDTITKGMSAEFL